MRLLGSSPQAALPALGSLYIIIEWKHLKGHPFFLHSLLLTKGYFQTKDHSVSHILRHRQVKLQPLSCDLDYLCWQFPSYTKVNNGKQFSYFPSVIQHCPYFLAKHCLLNIYLFIWGMINKNSERETWVQPEDPKDKAVNHQFLPLPPS